MVLRSSLFSSLLVFSLVGTCFGDGLWHPGTPGTAMTENLYNVDGTHRSVVWADHAGHVMAVDAAAVYDNWRTADDAPQVRISFNDTSVDLRNEDFVITARTQLRAGYGTRFHAGLCVVFSANDLLLWGPHGDTDLRYRRVDGVDHWRTYPDTAAYLKIKRSGNEYSAWYSSDGKNWTLSHTTTIATTPVAVGTILKTWSVPTAETVDFDYFELTNVQDEPAFYAANTRYGNTDGSALHFVYELSGVDILFRVFINDDGAAPDPEESKFYLIHATTNSDGDGCYDAILTYQRIATILEAGGQPNMVVVAPRFLRNNCPSSGDTHPYDYPLSWGYQNLEAEEDWILMDLHENYTRVRFPASTATADDRFHMVGHSGGGQYVTRFAMGHSDKLIRAVASSPWGTAFPTGEYEWEFGTYLPSDFRAGNPRFAVDLAGSRSLPLAVVVGENDDELDRGWAGVAVLSRTRLDNAMKWVRQMDSSSIDLYVVPERGHWFSPPKRDIAMAFLFGNPSPYSHLLYSSPDPDFQDVEQWDLFPFEIPDEQVFYFHFDRFPRDTRRLGMADRRYAIWPGGRCEAETIIDADTSTFAYVDCSVTHTAGELFVVIEEGGVPRTYGGIWSNLLYGKLRLYSTDAGEAFMLEESPAPNIQFFYGELVDRRMHLYECTGRGPDGPECGPFPLGAIELNGDLTVVDPDTGAAPTFHPMRNWVFDTGTSLLRFKDAAGAFLELQIGDWRWGEDATGQPFVAGLQTIESDGIPRREIQTNAIYNPRYFEDWDVAGLDYDRDSVTDIVDNCPVVSNGGQADSDGDLLGDACDPTPVNPPPFMSAGDGTSVAKVVVNWLAATGATHYRVYRSLLKDPATAAAVSTWQAATSFDDTTVTPGDDYFFWVRSAIGAKGEGASGFSMGNTGWAALAAPGRISASDGTFLDRVHVSWTGVSGAAAYRVRRSMSTDPLGAAAISPWLTRSDYDDATLAPGTVRYYWVEASPYAAGGRNSSLGGPDSGWVLPSDIFDDGFESKDLSQWSNAVP